MEKNTELSSQRDNNLHYSEDYIPDPKEYPVTEQDILKFAKQILFFTFVAFLLCLVGGVIFKIQVLFEIIKMGILPLVALIIGYYFGANR